MRYIILSSDKKQADYYFRRAKALLNPMITHQFTANFELVIGETKIRFIPKVDYYTGSRGEFERDAVVMNDVKFEEKVIEWVRTNSEPKRTVSKSCDNCKHGYKSERDKPCVTCTIPPYTEWEEK